MMHISRQGAQLGQSPLNPGGGSSPAMPPHRACPGGLLVFALPEFSPSPARLSIRFFEINCILFQTCLHQGFFTTSPSKSVMKKLLRRVASLVIGVVHTEPMEGNFIQCGIEPTFIPIEKFLS